MREIEKIGGVFIASVKGEVLYPHPPFIVGRGTPPQDPATIPPPRSPPKTVSHREEGC